MSRALARFAAPLVLAISMADAAAAQEVTPICTDRPTKSNYACTVQDGYFQYESDLLNTSIGTTGGVTTVTTLVTNPTVKYGVAPSIDLEANIAPLEVITTTGHSGHDGTIAGVGDLYLRVKYEFLDNTGGAVQAALIPYVKAPTARLGIGNGAVEGGLIAPVNIELNKMLTLTTDPEIDGLKDDLAGGRHLNTAQLINLAVALPRNVTLYGEIWGDWNFDPSGTVRQYSADTAVAYGLTPLLQVDAGVNLGLDRQTPAAVVYVGISQKF